MTMIPQVDLKACYLAQKAELDTAVQRVLQSGWYILGKEVETFEGLFACFCEVPHAVGVANGTDAVELALRAVGVKPGDRVATVSLTAVATVAAMEHLGAVPVLVDVDPQYATMCPQSLHRALEAHGPVKAVVPVHLYGHCADMDAIMAIAAEHGAVVVEDCAQAHGARWHGRRVGSMGLAGAFSFYPTKNLGAFGDGGAVVASDPEVAENLRLIRQYGWKDRYDSVVEGINSRLDELQAALLAVRLTVLEQENSRRRDIAAIYQRELAAVPGLALPVTRADEDPVWHQYVVRHAQRDALADCLRKAGIGTGVHYPLPVHTQRAYAGRVALDPRGLQQTETLCGTVLSLPMYAALSDDDALFVCRATLAACTRLAE